VPDGTDKQNNNDIHNVHLYQATNFLNALRNLHGKTKIENFSTVESEFWRNAGSSAFPLHETMLKSDKI